MSDKILTKKQPEKGMQTRKRNKLIFFIAMIAVPLLQFCIFYLYVNFNSIKMAFEIYRIPESGQGYDVEFAGIENFKIAWNAIFSTEGWDKIKYSLISYVVSLCIVTPLALFFSYYFVKKYLGHGMFRVLLYVPHIVGSVVMAVLYQALLGDDIYGKLTGNPGLISSNPNQAAQTFLTILIFNIWIGFGTNVMMYTGTMSSVDSSLTESASLEGVNSLQEFWYIYFPMIWPTFVTFIVTGMTGLFTNQMCLFNFFNDAGGSFETFGYYIFIKSKKARLEVGLTAMASYSEVSALGLLITLFLVPVILTVRKLMTKYGPRTD